jgi:hypothetical protein
MVHGVVKLLQNSQRGVRAGLQTLQKAEHAGLGILQ